VQLTVTQHDGAANVVQGTFTMHLCRQHPVAHVPLEKSSQLVRALQ
jgi:hypothetical protein